MADNEDVNTLKRRGRRRLAGAIALVLLAVIVLPMVFDSEPRRSAPPVSVRIPGEEDSTFTPKVTPKPAPAAPMPAEPTPSAERAAPAEKPVEKPAAQPEAKPAGKEPAAKAAEAAAAKPESKAAEAERARAQAALEGGPFLVPAGAYLDPAAAVDKLKAAQIPFTTQKVAIKDGTVTRVIAGPFATREAAERAAKRIQDLGLKTGKVETKS
ncbi:MAG TPA: SPOR domain-containing protein [Burkholderiales bacterium]|nr:SPOR domain-containing protein [Burkholderiales bacterium]